MRFIFKLIFKILVAAMGAIVVIFVGFKIYSLSFIKDMDKLSNAHTAIVLGASVTSAGQLSSILKDRADIAISLYKNGKVKTILITGDDGTEYHNEVNPTRDYMLSQGVPTEAIFLDHAGFDTYSSMYRARDIFMVDSAIIVTQSFHLPRSLFIARSLGIKAYGARADQHEYLFKNNIREVFADVKAVIDVVSKREPKFLGEEIPITGDSSESI
ncbi:MAG: hypothetical protein JWN37_696 [Candidatus Nomurabacteria bacterium]|nr:hypothetical protein [Candidatus Nomurabacteria bacterium]